MATAVAEDRKVEARAHELSAEIAKVYKSMEQFKRDCDSGSLRASTFASSASKALGQMMREIDDVMAKHVRAGAFWKR